MSPVALLAFCGCGAVLASFTSATGGLAGQGLDGPSGAGEAGSLALDGNGTGTAVLTFLGEGRG